MSMQDELDVTLSEDTRHARIGGCLALLIFPPILLAICWAVFALTPGGQVVTAWGILQLTYNGLPVHEFAEGFPGIARLSCSLDRENPRPANYEETQENLETLYLSMLDSYRDAYFRLQRNKEDLSEFEEPDNIPGNLVSAKIYFCNRR